MSDSYSPLLLTVDGDGRVTYDFEGHIHAEGLDLDAGTSSTPPDDRKIRWLRESDGAMLAEIYTWTGGGGSQDQGLLILHARDRATPNNNAQLEVNAGGDGSSPRVMAAAALEARTIVNSVGGSDFVQRVLVDAKGDLLVGTAADTIARKAVGANGRALVADSAQADGLAWVALGDAYMAPVALYPDTNALNTALATNTSYFVYVGRLKEDQGAMTVIANCVVALAGAVTWAEVGIFKGLPVYNGGSSLTRLGFADVSAAGGGTKYTTAGGKSNTIGSLGAKAGDDIWLAFGSEAATPYQVRALLPDDSSSGVFQTFAGRISTMAIPTATTKGIAGGPAPPRCVLQL